MVAPFVFSFVTGSTVGAEHLHRHRRRPARTGPSARRPPSRSRRTPRRPSPSRPMPDTIWSSPVGGTCGGSLSGSIFTTSPVTADCTVTAAFAVDGGGRPIPSRQAPEPNGSISPSGAVSVSNGATRGFTITAAVGVSRGHARGRDLRRQPVGQHVYDERRERRLHRHGKLRGERGGNHTVTASAGANGTISPSGAVTVNHGATQTFTITADSNYHVVTPVGGTCGGSLSGSTYTTNAGEGRLHRHGELRGERRDHAYHNGRGRRPRHHLAVRQGHRGPRLHENLHDLARQGLPDRDARGRDLRGQPVGQQLHHEPGERRLHRVAHFCPYHGNGHAAGRAARYHRPGPPAAGLLRGKNKLRRERPRAYRIASVTGLQRQPCRQPVHDRLDNRGLHGVCQFLCRHLHGDALAGPTAPSFPEPRSRPATTRSWSSR